MLRTHFKEPKVLGKTEDILHSLFRAHVKAWLLTKESILSVAPVFLYSLQRMDMKALIISSSCHAVATHDIVCLLAELCFWNLADSKEKAILVPKIYFAYKESGPTDSAPLSHGIN